MNLDLNDEQTEALVRLLRRAIDEDRFPLSPRLDPPPRPEPLPPLKPDMAPTRGQGRRRR